MRELAALIDTLLEPAEYERRTYAGLAAIDTKGTPADELDLAIANAIARLGAGRVFVVDYPANQAALAQTSDGVAARFELIIDGLEVANGYHELQDAEELGRRFARDNEVRRKRNQQVVDVDMALLAAHASGLPDCAGVAVGFDRLVALKLGVDALANAMPFPRDRA